MPLLQLAESRCQQTGPNRDSTELAVDIIAVHGLNENMIEAWTDPASGFLWLRDLLPKAISVARVLTFGYNAYASSFYGSGSADRIQQHAQTLVAELQADRSLEGCSKRPIIFICHGLGGILVKKALAYSSTRTSKNVEHLYSIFLSTFAILFFGTPHFGVDKASWLAMAHAEDSPVLAGAWKENQLLSAIEKDSETLQAITDQFSHLLKQFHIFFLWEELQSDLGGRQEYVVEESSAAPMIDNTERSGIHANHAQMVRFTDAQSSSYRTVLEALVRYCRSAPPVIARRWLFADQSLTQTRSQEAFELTGTIFDVHQNDVPFQYQRKASDRPRNRHFDIPQVVSSIFTGREDVSRMVEDALFASDAYSSGQQRRYIVHGIGGSGKTQFCSKFAQDHRERFWGVFWIDATSTETAKQSFAKIGKIGGMEATKSAGKHWLSNLDEPWLLIINNADDPNLDLSDLFPDGDRGHILVSTRNPDFRVHGTVGSTEFKGLKENEALVLLLRAADIPLPWDPATESTGKQITSALGYLALALVHAGASILQRICEIKDYLDFYNQHRKKLSLRRSLKGTMEQDHITVYATWDLSLDSLQLRHTEASMDAAQILSIVAFFHFEHIRVDIFTKALANRLKATDSELNMSFPARVLYSIRLRLNPRLVLPEFLRQEPPKLGVYRIRRALHELYSLSLISYDGKDDSFSLHPVVHAWARDRLEKGGQGLWAHIALNVLTESILLPPQDAGLAYEEYRRDILPHLDICLDASPIQIFDYDARFGGLKLPFGLIFQHTWLLVFREQVLKAAKCGYVYAERGRFKEAAELLSRVKDALIKSRGYQDESTMRAMLALAATYWGLGRLKEAVNLQSIVVEARKKSLGSNHSDTLSAMDQLGRSFWLNGQYKDALDLQTLTVERMGTILGSTHHDTLTAMDNLGVTYGSWQRYEESRDIHRQVLAIREKDLGPSHLDTLTTMNNLAMALKDLGRLNEAEELMSRVYGERKVKLGKEHPWTLWALCNLAKVHTDLKHFQTAEEMLIPGIAAAKRSLSEDHLGVLMGEGELARVYARQGRLEEAVRLTSELIKRLENSRGPSHPDCIYSLSKLAQLYEQMGRVGEAIGKLQLARERIDERLTMQHPLARKLCLRLKRLQQRQQAGSDTDEPRATPADMVDVVDIPIFTQSSKPLFAASTKKLRKHETF